VTELDIAAGYLAALLQVPLEDAVRTPVMWRAIWREKQGPKPHVLAGSLLEHADRLGELNQQGWGIYLQVNAGQGTTAKDIRHVRALFVDKDDGPLVDAPFPPGGVPSFFVHSGRGDHAYWLTPPDGPDGLAHFRDQQKALIRAMGTDPKICDLPRVMRVPGFRHTKDPDRDKWPMVRLSVSTIPGPRAAADTVRALTVPPRPPTPAWAEWRVWCLAQCIKAAPEGTSQDGFNKAVYEAKDYMRAGLLDPEAARGLMCDAANQRGVSGVDATWASATKAASTAKWSGVVSTDVDTEHPVAPAGGAAANPADGAFFSSAHEEDVARDLIALWGGPERVRGVGGALYVYDPSRGVWGLLSGPALRSRIAQYHMTPCLSAKGTSTVLPVGIQARTRIAQALLESPLVLVPDHKAWDADAPAGVAFADGFWRASDGALVPHAPDQCATWRFEWAWGDGALDAPPPKWDRFFAEIWAGEPEEEISLRAAYVAAWFGATLAGQITTWNQALLCTGDGSNGKSVLLTALQRILPPSLVVTVPPHRWGDPYYCVRLMPPAMLNVVGELPANDLLSTDAFKSVLGGDRVTGRHPSERAVDFTPRCGHIFAANMLPGTVDRSEGFWSRIRVLPFGRRFARDGSTFTRLVEGLVGEGRDMVRWSLGWARTAQELGSLPEYQGGEDVKDEWRRDNDPVAEWADTRLKGVGCGESSARELYTDFGVWMAAHGHNQRSSNWWGRGMRRLGFVKRKTMGNYVYNTSLQSTVGEGG